MRSINTSSQVKGLKPRKDFFPSWKLVAFMTVAFHSSHFRPSDAQQPDDGPSLRDSLTSPLVVASGSSTAVTCVVRNLGNHSVTWKNGQGKVLTVGRTRVVDDPRFDVAHDVGGDVYVLTLENATVRDSGVYTCEVNTKPPRSSIHKLTVLPATLVAPPAPVANNSENVWGFSTPTPIDHEYSRCCVKKGVRHNCLGFCSIKNILEGTAGTHPSNCEREFPKIVECMAAGRNHVPCCEKARVPDICQDMCSGTYTIQTDDARTHVSCSAYTAPTLACIAEGVDILPPQPTELTAANVSDSSFVLKWSVESYMEDGSINQEIRDTPPIENYNVYLSKVKAMVPDDRRHPLDEEVEIHLPIDVPGSKTEVLIDDLSPFSLYNVSMVAKNSHGESLPSYYLLVLTLTRKAAARRNRQKQRKEKVVAVATPRPFDVTDVKECCRNIPNTTVHASCIDKFCDPAAVQHLKVIDFMICATWTWDMFSCLVDGKNHQPCCKRRGVPDVCSNFCSGNASAAAISHKHFRCQNHMADISNCFMEDYDVLPSEPRNFYFSNVGKTVGLLHWKAPRVHGTTVKQYRVHVDESITYSASSKSKVRIAEQSPFVVEKLKPGTAYIAYVEAENEYGLGPPSPIAVFRTASAKSFGNEGSAPSIYDQKLCCQSAGVKTECLSLCQYNASISESRRLVPLCTEDFHLITKCQAAGRDHMPCCGRRGVSVECQSLCQGTQVESKVSVYGTCVSYIGNIMTCFEEGVLTLPKPVRNFHAQYVDDSEVAFAWDKPTPLDDDQGGEVIQFEVYYKELRNNSGSALDHEKNINVTADTDILVITGLKPNTRHQFFVVARNEYGTSLPTSLITVLTNRTEWNGQSVAGKPSPPHEVTTSTGVDYISVSWTGPSISSPEDHHSYRLTYQPADNEVAKTTVETSSTSLNIPGLTPNTRYVLFINTVQVSADGSVEESEPSETLVAWTDPIVRAAVERPKITPSSVVEGSSFQVLCVGLGNPVPVVALYIDDHLIRSEKTRHLVTTVDNVSRYMRKVGCSAINTKSQDYKEAELNVLYKPNIKAVSQLTNSSSSELQLHTITCSVEAMPAPTIRFGRNDGRDLAITFHGDKVEAGNSSPSRSVDLYVTTPSSRQDNVYEAVLSIQNFVADDAASYYCSADNELGNATRNFDVLYQERKSLPRHDKLRSCCERENVDNHCLDICTFRLDMDLLSFEGNSCDGHFATFMKCGSDESDHRHCCQQKGVSKGCLDFCRGRVPPAEAVDASYCFNYLKEIGQCFQDGQYTLPGPPQNLRVTPVSAFSAVATWDPPVKNPGNVQLYRIIWRQPGKSLPQKIDTAGTNVTLNNLEPEMTYELVVKSGNSEGTSVLSPPITFVTADKYIVKTGSHYVYVNTSSVVGAFFCVMLVLGIVLGIVFWMKGRLPWKRSSLSITSSPSRSFENPFFNQEVNMRNLELRGSVIQAQINDDATGTEGGELPFDEHREESNGDKEAGAKSVASKLSKKLKWPSGGMEVGFQRFQ